MVLLTDVGLVRHVKTLCQSDQNNEENCGQNSENICEQNNEENCGQNSEQNCDQNRVENCEFKCELKQREICLSKEIDVNKEEVTFDDCENMSKERSEQLFNKSKIENTMRKPEHDSCSVLVCWERTNTETQGINRDTVCDCRCVKVCTNIGDSETSGGSTCHVTPVQNIGDSETNGGSTCHVTPVHNIGDSETNGGSTCHVTPVQNIGDSETNGGSTCHVTPVQNIGDSETSGGSTCHITPVQCNYDISVNDKQVPTSTTEESTIRDLFIIKSEHPVKLGETEATIIVLEKLSN